MGDLLGGLFGGGDSSQSSSSSSDSSNKAFDYLKGGFAPGVSSFGPTVNQLGNILGVNGGAGQAAGLKNYWNSAGGQFQLDQGLDALTSKFSALGLSKSGAAMKGMEKFRQNTASTYLNNYLSQLGELGKLGLGAGSVISSAGNVSHSESEGTGSGSQSGGGLGSLIGTIISTLPFIL